MNCFEELRPAAVNMLRSNLNLQPGERVGFVVDSASSADWAQYPYTRLEAIVLRSLMAKKIFEMMVGEFPDNHFGLICYPLTGQSGKEPPDETAHQMLNYDVLVMMNTYSLSHTNAREHASRQGIRVASMPGVDAAMFAPDGPMAADYQTIARETRQWAEMLTHACQVRIATPFGTDLSFSIAGRNGDADTGLLHHKGEFGNLPGGEAFIAPLEGTAVGKLAVPAGWHPDLKETMTFVFENGYVGEVIGGGEVGDYYRELFAFGDESKKHRRNCAELGIGTNPNARRPDNVLEAEKIRGTVHVAVGDNAHMGGMNESDLHEDFVLTQPSVWMDGKKVL